MSKNADFIEEELESVADVSISVLFVDAISSPLKTIKKALDIKTNLTVSKVQSADDATTQLKKQKYDAIICNNALPGKSGLDLLKMLRENKNSIPFVLITPTKNNEVELEALALGAERVITLRGRLRVGVAELNHTLSVITEKMKMAVTLQAGERKFHALKDTAKDGIAVIDEKGQLTHWNGECEKIFGYKKDEVMGKTIHFLMPPERARGFDQASKRVAVDLKGKSSGAMSMPAMSMPGVRKDGSIVQTEMSLSFFANGSKWLGLAIIRDVTERLKSENALRESEEQFRSLSENSPNMIFINQKGKVVYVNNDAADSMGYKKEEFYAPDFNFLQLIAPEFREAVKAKFISHMSGEKFDSYECKLVTKAGSTRDVIINSRVITYKDEPALLGIATDITERKKAELEIANAEEKFRIYVETSPVAVFVANPEGKYEYVNDAASDLLGFSRAELLTMSIPQLIFEEDLPETLRKFSEVKETGHSLSEVILKTKRGLPAYVILNAVKLPDGKLLAFCENVTARKKAEQELLMQTEQMKATFAASPDAIIRIDLKGNIVDCNEETIRLFVYPSKESIIGNSCLALLIESERPKALADMNDIFEKNKTLHGKEFVALKYSGEEFAIEVSESILRDASGQPAGIIATARDITERKKAEEQIRLLSSVVQQAVEGIAVSDPHGRILFVNSAWLKMHDFGEAEEKDLIGQWVMKFYCSQQIEAIDYQFQPSNVFRGRITQVKKDGTTFAALATLSPLKNAEGTIIGVIHMAKPLTEIVRDIRDVKSANACMLKTGVTEGK
jgi:PAS domain S-box-containing protein